MENLGRSAETPFSLRIGGICMIKIGKVIIIIVVTATKKALTGGIL